MRAGARVGPEQVLLRWRGGALPEDSPLTRTPRAQGDPAGRPSVFQVCGRRGVGGRRMLRSRGLRAGAGWTGRSRGAPPPASGPPPPPAVAPRLPRGGFVGWVSALLPAPCLAPLSSFPHPTPPHPTPPPSPIHPAAARPRPSSARASPADASSNEHLCLAFQWAGAAVAAALRAGCGCCRLRVVMTGECVCVPGPDELVGIPLTT